MANLCIIPARGGSKRIPRKNIKEFLGKPIISYAIENAIGSNIFDRVIVSTDDQEISEISKKYGAEVPFLRSRKNSDDYASTIDVVLETLNQISTKYETVCCLYPTTPLLNKQVLFEAYKRLISGSVSAVFPVLKYSFPIQRSLSLNEDKTCYMNWPENLNKRSQDLDPVYHDAGQFYFCKVKELYVHGTLYPPKSSCIILDEIEAQDIDNISDWKIAEMKFQLKNVK
jgi:pseudaminic acid cytidylyltransferase